MSFARIAVRAVATKAPITARVVPSMAIRSISSSMVMQKDVVQELLLKELKGYKPAATTKADETAVKDLKLPAAPAVPQVDADLAEQLAAYDAEPTETTF
ncbi:ATP synthase complex subunit H-domain-containing protein [Spinellus fusiger]|nr:ATP synthase complex subunit H-domain-containing protein [Spinellus fusiger]